MNNTAIEWCDFTWNPVTGCPGPKVSPGCDNCYAERTMNTRLRHLYAFKDGYRIFEQEPFQRVWFHQDRLDQPRKLKKPSRIFVGSMCDLFHDDVETEVLERVFWEFSKTPQHIFMLLTKRPEKMRWWFTDGLDLGALHPNVWIGVTVCNQAEADAKIPVLLDIPAAKRFVSVEPMLGPVDLTALDPMQMHVPEMREINALTGVIRQAIQSETSWHTVRGNRLDWVICGGETGPKARPVNYAWVYKLAEQCWSAGTPFFFKGWGEWTPAFYQPDGGYKVHQDADLPDGFTATPHVFAENPGIRMYRVGKRRSGRMLNGCEWNEVPS